MYEEPIATRAKSRARPPLAKTGKSISFIKADVARLAGYRWPAYAPRASNNLLQALAPQPWFHTIVTGQGGGHGGHYMCYMLVAELPRRMPVTQKTETAMALRGV